MVVSVTPHYLSSMGAVNPLASISAVTFSDRIFRALKPFIGCSRSTGIMINIAETSKMVDMQPLNWFTRIP
jgi:hypothetical protein